MFQYGETVPFELSGAAAVTREENGEIVRYWKPYLLYVSRPYDVAVRTLATDVIAVAEIIEGWSEETIVVTGKRASLPQKSRT
jgi:hypothetical protein